MALGVGAICTTLGDVDVAPLGQGGSVVLLGGGVDSLIELVDVSFRLV